MQSNLEAESPCIGYCSTTFGDDMCLGCGRSAQEVVQWISLTDAEKKLIWNRITSEGTAIRFRKK
jgi:predicted Fe-S protein YdhL (DUF1289 family)